MSDSRSVLRIANYVLTGKVLGKGNFAKVLEAVHFILEKKVAIKVIDTAEIEEYALKNLQRETKVLFSVSHPCIVYMYEAIQYHPLYCIVTELVPGMNLSDFIEKQSGSRLDERTARRFLRQLSSALKHMHERGIVHRDLKMQNVMVDTEQSILKIIDFGLSNFWSEKEPLSTHCGSPEYAAPELFITNRTYGPEVDLWSLGIIAYGMAVGHVPFYVDQEAENAFSSSVFQRLLVSRIRKGLQVHHKNSLSHYAKDFTSFVAGLLNTNPMERFRIDEVVSHTWMTKSRSSITQVPSSESNSDTHEKILYRLCSLMHQLPKDVESRLVQEPLGPFGGMHRILHHEELKKLWQILEIFSPLHAFSGSLSSGSLISRVSLKEAKLQSIAKVKSTEACKTITVKKAKPAKDTKSVHKNPEKRPVHDYRTRDKLLIGSGNSAYLKEQSSLVICNTNSLKYPYNSRKGFCWSSEPSDSSSTTTSDTGRSTKSSRNTIFDNVPNSHRSITHHHKKHG